MLCARAEDARRNAYAPYSGFRVGAAVRSADGEIYVGCNVENASYGATICAERAAVAAAIASGRLDFDMLAIATDASEPTPPCGLCRQVLVEVATDLVVVSRTVAGAEARWTLAELLPRPFTLDAERRS